MEKRKETCLWAHTSKKYILNTSHNSQSELKKWSSLYYWDAIFRTHYKGLEYRELFIENLTKTKNLHISLDNIFLQDAIRSIHPDEFSVLLEFRNSLESTVKTCSRISWSWLEFKKCCNSDKNSGRNSPSTGP